jgi:DNA-directed RNA polymerase specialized sigma24 family protein
MNATSSQRTDSVVCVVVNPNRLATLLSRASQGDQTAIAAAYAQLYAPMVHVAKSVMRRRVDEAEDVVQDFFLALLEGRAASFVPKGGDILERMLAILRAMARRHDSGEAP